MHPSLYYLSHLLTHYQLGVDIPVKLLFSADATIHNLQQLVTNNTGNRALRKEMDPDKEIDWKIELQLPQQVLEAIQANAPYSTDQKKEHVRVLLTGATGFLG